MTRNMFEWLADPLMAVWWTNGQATRTNRSIGVKIIQLILNHGQARLVHILLILDRQADTHQRDTLSLSEYLGSDQVVVRSKFFNMESRCFGHSFRTNVHSDLKLHLYVCFEHLHLISSHLPPRPQKWFCQWWPTQPTSVDKRTASSSSRVDLQRSSAVDSGKEKQASRQRKNKPTRPGIT